MRELKRIYAHNPEAVEALTYMRAVALEHETIEQVKEKLELKRVEIIPPERRLQPAAIERLMQQTELEQEKPLPIELEIVEPETPTLCQHGNLPGECRVIDIGKDQCPHFWKGSQSTNALEEPSDTGNLLTSC